MIEAGTAVWFARHESRLAWRDWLSMMTAGRRARARGVAIGFVAFIIFMHAVAYFVVGPSATAAPDKHTMITITATLLLAWLLMISQAMESMTRAFYARADLDLILASPAAAHKLFAIRISTVALTVAVMALPLAGPFIDMLIWRGGIALARCLRSDRRHGHGGGRACGGADGRAVPRHRPEAHPPRCSGRRRRDRRCFRHRPAGGGDPVLRDAVAGERVAVGRLVRARARCRQRHLVAGARCARRNWRRSPAFWFLASLLLAIAVALVAPRFGEYAVAAAGAENAPTSRAQRRTIFRITSPRRALRRKEWMLLRRDPWLVSQTLMQMLYLVPPAILLWRSFQAGGGAVNLLVPVLVMAAGQLVRRSRLAHHLRRRRARSRRHRAGARGLHPARQDRGGARHHRRDVRAAGRGARHRLAVARARYRRSASSLLRRQRPRSSSGSAPRPNEANSAAARSPRGSRRLPRRSPRSAGPRPPRSPPSVSGSPSRRRSSPSRYSAARAI